MFLRVNVGVMHLLMTIGLVVLVGLSWGMGYGFLVMLGLFWLETLVIIAVGIIENGKDRRGRAIEAARDRRMAVLDQLVTMTKED
jgi:hypothetical protein